MTTVYQVIFTGIDTTGATGPVGISSFNSARINPQPGDAIQSVICIVSGSGANQWQDFVNQYSSTFIEISGISNNLQIYQVPGQNFAGAKFLALVQRQGGGG